MRINPVGLSRVAARRNAMGIVRQRGRDAARLLSHAREREGGPTSSDDQGVGQEPVDGPRAEWKSWPGMARGTALATGRVSAVVGRARARPEWCHEVSGGAAACTIAVICIRPSPHTGQRERSIPMSRCRSTATDSRRVGSGGG